jgi:hypothetical protein
VALVALEQNRDGAAPFRPLDVVEVQVPETTVVGETRGGDEVEVVAAPRARIPRPVLRTLKARDAVGDRGLLEGQPVEVGDVAQVEEAEAPGADESGRGVAEAELVALLGDRLAGCPCLVLVPT